MQNTRVWERRYALWKNPDDLNRRQGQQLDWIAKTDSKLWRAYLLKEGLRYVFAVKGTDMSLLTQADFDKAAHSLNGRPRQALDGMSPSEKLAEVLQ